MKAKAHKLGLPTRQTEDRSYAFVLDYLEFPTPVPFVTGGRYAEAPLREITDARRILTDQRPDIAMEEDLQAALDRIAAVLA